MNSAISPAASHNVPAEQSRVTGPYARAGLLAGVVAGVATTVIAVVLRLFDVQLEAQGEEFPALAFAQVSLIGALIGVGLAAGLVRRARRPRHTFVVATVVLTVLSFVPPMLIGAGAVTVLVLEAMHVVAAVIVIPAIAARIGD